MSRRRKIWWKVRPFASHSQPKFLWWWLTQRCETCSHRRRFMESWHTYGNRDGKVWHRYCTAYEGHRTAGDELLAILDLITDVWQISGAEVQSLVALRTADDATGSADRNAAFRVMYALDNRRKAARAASPSSEADA